MWAGETERAQDRRYGLISEPCRSLRLRVRPWGRISIDSCCSLGGYSVPCISARAESQKPKLRALNSVPLLGCGVPSWGGGTLDVLMHDQSSTSKSTRFILLSVSLGKESSRNHFSTWDICMLSAKWCESEVALQANFWDCGVAEGPKLHAEPQPPAAWRKL